MSYQTTDKIEILEDILTLLSVDGIGIRRFYQLVNSFGSPGDVLNKTIQQLSEIPGIGRELASSIVNKQSRKKAREIGAKIINLGWKFFLYDDAEYPEALQNISDHPPCLFYYGDYIPEDFNAIAIVGSRTATEEGRHFTTRLAYEMTDNHLTVVSGMARGIDTCAHRGAIQAGGRTIAVFGSSLDIIYPPENKNIAAGIVKNGAIFSEYLPGTEPFAANFTNRNRIISGLSQGVVIVEAADRSGALSTAGHALKQNREVFAVPGPPGRNTSKGANKLIKNGARLLTNAQDIFDELPRLKGDVKVIKAEKLEDLTDTEKDIINLFTDGPVHLDIISRSLKQPVNEIMPVLLALELKGIIKELSGKRFILE